MELHTDAPKAAVLHEHVEAGTEREYGELTLSAELRKTRQCLDRVGARERVGGAADAQRRVARQRNVEADALAEKLA